MLFFKSDIFFRIGSCFDLLKMGIWENLCQIKWAVLPYFQKKITELWLSFYHIPRILQKIFRYLSFSSLHKQKMTKTHWTIVRYSEFNQYYESFDQHSWFQCSPSQQKQKVEKWISCVVMRRKFQFNYKFATGDG